MERIKLLENAIQELHEVKIKAIKAEINRAKKEAAGFSIFMIAVAATISCVIYWTPAIL